MYLVYTPTAGPEAAETVETAAPNMASVVKFHVLPEEWVSAAVLPMEKILKQAFYLAPGPA